MARFQGWNSVAEKAYRRVNSMTTNDEMSLEKCCQAFADSYEVSNLPAMREVERTVLGCDYGGTSWTTSKQAEQIVDLLELRSGVHLLDIGSGSGWPGLFLADKTGCDVTLVDLPLNALGKARDRVRNDGIDGRVSAVAGSGAALPFRDGTFHAISHSDVLCCLPEKREMLRECRRVASDGATMLFSVIAVTQGLTEAMHRSAVDAGPPFVDAPGDYAELLSQSGWRISDRIDVTAEHRKSLAVLVDAFGQSTELSDALGQDVVNESRIRRQTQIEVSEAGLLVREIFLVAAS